MKKKPAKYAKSPSKNMTLGQLKRLQADGFYNPDTGLELDKGEASDRIRKLESRNAEAQADKWLERLEKQSGAPMDGMDDVATKRLAAAKAAATKKSRAGLPPKIGGKALRDFKGTAGSRYGENTPSKKVSVKAVGPGHADAKIRAAMGDKDLSRYVRNISEGADPELLEEIRQMREEKRQGRALKNAESMAPANSEVVKNSVPKNVNDTKKAKRVMGGVVPEGASKAKPFNFKSPSVVDDVFKAPAKKGIGKAIKRGAMSAAILGPIGLGVNALMEGLDAEEAGSEQEVLDAAEMRQAEKTNALVGGKKLPAMVEASTKKKVVAKPLGRSDEDIVKGFNGLLDDNFGPEDGEEGEEENDNEDSVMVTEREESEDGPVTARYRLKMKGKGGLSPDDKARAAALHSQLRKPGKQMSGEMDIPEYGEKVKIRRR